MRKIYCLLSVILMLTFASTIFGQNVAINTDGSFADPNAILDVKSTNKGVLIPRIDYANRPTVSVASGMMIYVTANGPDGNNAFYYNDGSQWLKVRNHTEQQSLALGHDTLFLSQGNFIVLGTVLTSQGFIKCGANYINPSQDNNNCGACGNVCPAGKICSNGACVLSCQAGLTNCSGICINTASDISNCGFCGHVCPAGQVCVAGNCTLSCQAGLSNCSGTCTNLGLDNNNCGGCGIVCVPGKVCANGNCVLSCQAGLTNCAGTCTNTQTSNSSCGFCGNVCAAGKICVNGVCTLTCQAGLTNCAGTCVNPANDNNNCGFCGHVCAAGHACLNGNCL
jgi:adhesin HecA-like repeat protein